MISTDEEIKKLKQAKKILTKAGCKTELLLDTNYPELTIITSNGCGETWSMSISAYRANEITFYRDGSFHWDGDGVVSFRDERGDTITDIKAVCARFIEYYCFTL